MANEQWCRHYRAMAYHESCEVGVVYKTVRDDTGHPYRYPCFTRDHAGCLTTCALFEHFTKAEIDEENRKVDEFLDKMRAFSERKTDVCFHCGKPVTALRQVGRCVYASCGCRLWQGTVPEAWR